MLEGREVLFKYLHIDDVISFIRQQRDCLIEQHDRQRRFTRCQTEGDTERLDRAGRLKGVVTNHYDDVLGHR